MPELPEVEAYRALAAQRALDRAIKRVDAPDAWYLKAGLTADTAQAVLRRRRFTAARRIGKLLVLDVDSGHALGLRFGMTGRLVVDGHVGVDGLIYSSNRNDVEAWDRFVVHFRDGGDLRMRDPRRLGGVLLDPDEARLGVDARTMTLPELRAALAGGRGPLKARLLDQSRFAGVGNLIADEALWRAGLDPRRTSGELTPEEQRRLHRHLKRSVEDLIERGGSHTGDFLPHRRTGATCPKDGSPLERATIGGRTTWWCPSHQA